MYRIAIADCKKGVYKAYHDNYDIKVGLYRTTEDRTAYGFNLTTEQVIYNPDFAVLGQYQK